MTTQRSNQGGWCAPRAASCRPRSAIVLLYALVFAAILSSLHAASAERPPNILFILLDNVGQEWFGCYGSEENCTPNIDRLAKGGVRVENCYTPPVCGPSRTVLLTGR